MCFKLYGHNLKPNSIFNTRFICNDLEKAFNFRSFGRKEIGCYLVFVFPSFGVFMCTVLRLESASALTSEISIVLNSYC